jgi:hypothetical protein
MRKRWGLQLIVWLIVWGLLGVPAWGGDADQPIPLPGEEAIPLPGDEPVPLPGADTDTSEPAPGLPALTQPFEFRGYFENTTNVEYLKEQADEIILNAGRVRLNLAGEPALSLDFGIGLVGTLNTGATEISLTDYLPDDAQAQILPAAEPFFGYHLEDEDLFVQEAFGTLYTEHLKLRVGRHKFYTGTGYAYNPIDLFNPKDPLDPTYETDGLDALLLRVNLPSQTELQGLVRWGDDFAHTDYLARVKTYRRGWDLALQYTAALKEQVDWAALNTDEAVAGVLADASLDDFTREFRWHLLAAEFAGELWGWAVYGEGGYALVEAEGEVGTLTNAAQDHERLLLGVDRTFANQVYVLLEYLRLGQGRAERDAITLNDRMAYFTGEVLAITQDTLFSGVWYPVTDLLEGALYAIIGLNDASALLNPWLIYDVRPGLKLSLSLNIPLGAEESQNGKAGVSGFARLKWHF